MKSLKELNAQIEEQEKALKKLRAEKNKIIDGLSANYCGKYIKLIAESGSFCIMKINKVSLDELDTPYKYYGTTFKFCKGDYQFDFDKVLFDDDFESIEAISEEEYNEYVKKFIDKIFELK